MVRESYKFRVFISEKESDKGDKWIKKANKVRMVSS